MALSNIRAGSINSLNEASLQAQMCKLKYEFVKDRMLSEPVWNFNRKIKAPALLDSKIPQWTYLYKYPVDCLSIRNITPISGTASKIEYDVFNFEDDKVIGTNQVDIYLDYSATVNDPNMFTNDFIMALSHLLAAEMAIPIVGGDIGRGLRSDSLSIYNRYLASALVSDLNEYCDEPVESEFVTVRG